MQDRRLFYKFNRAQHLLYHHVEKELLSALGITPIQLGAIFFLLSHDGCLQKDLASGLHLNKPAVTGLVSRMENAGLILKQGSSRDGRAVHIRLTGKAQKLASRAFPLLEKFNKEITKGFSEENVRVIHEFLDSIIQRLAKGGTGG